MILPTIEEMTNLYLYGQKTKPSDLITDQLIRPDDFIKPFSVDINAYMAGPGRFATLDKFNIVEAFLSQDPDLVPTFVIPPGTYTKEQLNDQFFGFNKVFITLYQSNYGVNDTDFLTRAYIWESVAFKLDDRTRFVVKPDGNREIINYAVTQFSTTGTESFDFDSSNPISIAANIYLEPRIDPSAIGREVKISFDGERTINTTSSYTYSNYIQDQQNSAFHPIDGSLALLNRKEELINDLWSAGSIKFLGSDNKPIFYGKKGSPRRAQ